MDHDRLTFDLFINEKLLAALCDLLTVMHVDTVLNSIACLDKIMDYGMASGIDGNLREMLETCNASEKFEFLTKSTSYEIFNMADRFINKYLEQSDEADLRCNF